MNTASLQRALSFDPPALLIDRFCLEHNVTKGEAEERFLETKKFLVVCASNPTIKYAPSKSIDDMWHNFMLHSLAYFDFCALLGGYIHHQPSERHEPNLYTKTIEDLKRSFGTINTAYWEEVPAGYADCTSCSNCAICNSN
jgi:hypothetical protein